MPDVPKGTPMVPARLEWKSGETMIIPDDDGLPKMVPKYDPMLEDFVEKHSHNRPDNEVIGGLIRVWVVDQRTWDAVDVTTRVRSELQKNTGDWYEERSEYLDAALKCYNAHGNPDMGNKCPDFLDDSKRIGHAEYTGDDGQVIRVPNRFRQYLCYQCPYMQSHIMTEIRWRQGLYR